MERALGAQFKIGLYSEAMIGNVGLPNKYRKKPLPPDRVRDHGLSDFERQLSVGTVVTEDFWTDTLSGAWKAIERYFMYFVRSFTPSRAWANLLRFRHGGYRETRNINGSPDFSLMGKTARKMANDAQVRRWFVSHFTGSPGH
jgi:hypothetical protein